MPPAGPAAGARLSIECTNTLTPTVTYSGQDVAWSAFVDGLASDNAITEGSFLLDGIKLSKGADITAIFDVSAAFYLERERTLQTWMHTLCPRCIRVWTCPLASLDS